GVPVHRVNCVRAGAGTRQEVGLSVGAAMRGRARAPRESVVPGGTPLPDSGKRAKPQLRRDAARGALRGALADTVGAGVDVDVVADETAGTRAVLTLKERASADTEQRVRALMASYPLAYTIEWSPLN